MTERAQRRLAAIVSADVVGYSRLMGVDEVGTLAALRAHRTELIDDKITEHSGRIVKTMGDGLLLEFPSVVDATKCIVEIQSGMAKRNQDVDEDQRITFRVGINIGDIIVEGEDILGDGVNIAARLQEIAQPGGVAISGRVHDDVRDRLDVGFANAGEQNLKNIARPVQVWQWTPAVFAATKKTASNVPLQLPDRPSIAILPFDNMSGDPEQEYFSDGITEDITTALSRISDLFVIARNSAFSYKNRAIDVRQVGTELGVRYILEGSVRKAGSRMRITGQLIDAETGAHIWADKFDSAIEDVFELQDLVTAAVAGAIGPSVTQAEIKRASLKPTDNLQAYDYFLKALGESALYTRDGTDKAIQFARRAIKMDPKYAQAYAYIASWHCSRKTHGWMENEAGETDEGIRFANMAVQLQPNDPTVLTQAAFALGHLNRDLETAIPWFDRAIKLNPNSAMAFGRSAVVRNFAADYERAIEHADTAIRLSPFDTFIFAFSMARGVAHLFRRELPEAISWLRKAAQENPRHSSTFMNLGSALAHTGEHDDARAAMRRFLQMRPMSSVAWQRQRRLYPEDDYEFLLEGACKAGLPK